MGRKSAIKQLAPEARKHIEKLLREDRLTLDDMLDDIREHFPSDTPSRSGLHRYKANFEELAGRMREIETAAAVLVDELGEGMGDKAGALLAQAVTTLAANAALRAHETDNITIKEVGELARAARSAMQARTMSLKERQVVEQAARERLLQEQNEKLTEMRGTDGMSEQLEQRIRNILLGKA